MKQLTLNQAWRLCLKQWKWIVENLDDEHGPEELKVAYLHKFGKGVRLCLNCYFCEYDANADFGGCRNCPGKLVERRFHCNTNKSYSWRLNPRAFYAKLLELDKKRKAK